MTHTHPHTIFNVFPASFRNFPRNSPCGSRRIQCECSRRQRRHWMHEPILREEHSKLRKGLQNLLSEKCNVPCRTTLSANLHSLWCLQVNLNSMKSLYGRQLSPCLYDIYTYIFTLFFNSKNIENTEMNDNFNIFPLSISILVICKMAASSNANGKYIYSRISPIFALMHS